MKDKIIIDCNGDENKALAEKLSRAEPGDEIEFKKVCGSLDEYQNGVATISITEVEVSAKEKSEPKEKPEAEEPEAASVSIFKRAKKKETE